MRPARRLDALHSRPLVELERKAAAAAAAGVNLISFGVGNLGYETPGLVIAELHRAAQDPENHRYPHYMGVAEFRAAVARFYRKRFGVEIDPDTQVLALAGAKEGIAHLPWAFIDPGDTVLVPAPGYPTYETGAVLSGGSPVHMRLSAEQGWYPDFDLVDGLVTNRTKMAWLNYPANPTGAVATRQQLERAVRFAIEHRLIIGYDNTYSEITYDGFIAPSILEVPEAMKVAVEFGSLSKTMSMPGWRIGWAVGNPVIVRTLGYLMRHNGSGVFPAVQRAAAAALDSDMSHLDGLVATYRRRRDAIMNVFVEAGWPASCSPRGGLTVWLAAPKGESGVEFASRLIDQAGVVVAPGNGHGPGGEGYVRLALAVSDDLVDEGCERIRGFLRRSGH